MRVELSGGVSVSYRRGGPPALNGVDVRIRSGDMVAVIGASGAGKSTLFRLLTRGLVTSGGRVSIDGADIAALSLSEVRTLRRRIGTIHQRGDLVDGSTVMRNVEIGTLADAGALAALALAVRGGGPRVQASCRRALRTLEIEHLAEARIGELSGGERQRAAVCRLLVQRPGLILADEPTASVDERSAALVLGALRALSGDNGSTLLLATHDIDVARQADRVVALARGQVVYDGPSSRCGDDVVRAAYARAGDLAPAAAT